MKSRFKSVLAGAGALAIASGMLLATSGSALALQTPAYEPDSNATLGGVDFFNASGVQITTGPVTGAPFAAFAVAQTTPSTATPLATLFAATPNSGRVTALGTSFANTFSNEQLSDSTNYPITAATPADIHGIANPVVSGAGTDEDLATYITHIPNADTSTTDGYGNLYQIRVKVSGATGYAAATIQVTGTTWTQVSGSFRLFADTTTTTLTPTPASPQVPGTNVTLNATVVDTTSGATIPVGTVSFYDGAVLPANLIGAAQPVSGTGTASVSTTGLSTATHTLNAVFTPTNATLFATSTGTASYTIGNLDVSHTAVSTNPTSGVAFTPVDLTATVTDTTPPGTAIPTGSVQFFDGATPIGSPVALAAGVALLHDTAGFSFTAPAPTVHSITAQYLGSATIAGSTSAAVTFSVTGAPACPNGEAATLCTDPQTVVTTVTAGTITITTPYSPASPLVLPNMVLNSHGTGLSTSAPFGSTIGPVTDPTGTENEIFVTDTRAGDADWTASVQSSNFVGIVPTHVIDGQNAGLINVTAVPVTGNALTSANVAVHDNPSGTPPIVPLGTQGIGGAKHTFANTTAGGDGSIGFTGTFTLNAPTSTAADTYTATVTFTVG